MVLTITIASADFTGRDFDSWNVELRSRATAAFPNWTDFNTPNFGNILLELFAHTLDVISFSQDQQFRETRIAWAQLRRSMIHLGRNVGFKLPGAVPAIVDLTFQIADGLTRTTAITIPATTVIQTPDLVEKVEFDLIADAVIGVGLTEVTAQAAENARVEVENFITDGTANQEQLLPQTPFVDNSVVLVIGLDTFTQPPAPNTDTFLSSLPTDKHFIIDVDENDRGTIRFGDGINGAIPTGAAVATYKVGGGADGNVDANQLKEFRDGARFATVAGEQVQLLVTNPIAAAGGIDRMSVEEARVAIPASLASLGNRSVTRLDFETNARKDRRVARSMMLTADDSATIPENEGELYIIPVGGGLPSAQLLLDVADLINTSFPPTITFTFQVLAPSLLIISITATVFLNVGITEPVARTAIETSLQTFFALTTPANVPNVQIDFGFKIRTERMPVGTTVGDVPWSDIFNAVRDAVDPSGNLVSRSVDEDVFVPADSVLILDTEFPVLGSVTLINGDTTLAF